MATNDEREPIMRHISDPGTAEIVAPAEAPSEDEVAVDDEQLRGGSIGEDAGYVDRPAGLRQTRPPMS